MKTLADGSVDAVVTSPPYNIGKHYNNIQDDRDDYIDWLVDVIIDLARITADALWINLRYRKTKRGNVPIAFEIWDRVPLYLMQSITWAYGAGMTYRSRFNHRSEGWLWFVRNPDSYVFNPDDVRDISLTEYPNDKRNNPNGKLPGDVWYFTHVKGNVKDRCDHPAQYPEKMIERIAKACTLPGATVLDPFMGSGTTGVACVQTGRDFIGFEIDPTYFTIAEKRIAEAQMQPTLEGVTL